MSTKSLLKPYIGPLNPKEIKDGIAFAQANALRLLGDAKLLLDAKRYPTATALAILSLEEQGKITILKRFALLSDPDEVKLAWKEYRNHRSKNAGWIIPQLAAGGARSMKDMESAVDSKSEHSAVLDSLKQVSLYTDCLAAAHWSSPDNVIKEELAQSIVWSADVMWGAKEVTLREIELWREIVGPYYKQPGMMDAVLRWQKAMVDEGLSEIEPRELAKFMSGMRTN
ncbi:MAG: AbiV family abortive infection protein [Pseudomonadota bacterium]